MSRPIAALAAIALLSTLSWTLTVVHGSSTSQGITMSSNETKYVLGERVQLTGKVEFPLNLNNLMRMTIYTPSGEIYRIDEFEINTDGGFTWSFTLPTTEAGKWIVNARFDTREAEVVIDALVADVFDKIYIESANVLDLYGNNITATGGSVGKSLTISTILVNDEQIEQSFMLLVQILDQERTAESMILTLGSLEAGESIERSVSWLPEKKGNYTAEIFVWSSLDGPMPLVEKHSTAFSINS
ncbi:MAG: hypothetical protein AB1351_06470 [Thermoproteota archaeon]